MSETILVTGGSGFIGQHIIRALQEHDPGNRLREIRVLDLVPWSNVLGHPERVPITVLTGSILDEDLVRRACSSGGVSTIIHAAARRDLSVWQDGKHCTTVNVDGTHVLLESAIAAGVSQFIFISSVDVLCGYDPIYYGAENTAPEPRDLILGKYAESKRDAERLVMSANGRHLNDGVAKLTTVILRPTVTYGEGDRKFVTEALEVASRLGGRLVRIENIFTRLQPTYVGNVAWSVVRTLDTLRSGDTTIGGEAIFITDDTPLVDPYDFLEPFMTVRGFSVTRYPLPYWLVWCVLRLVTLIGGLVSYWSPSIIAADRWPRELNIRTIGYLVHTFFFNRDKATLRIDYQPLVSAAEARERSLEYYRTVPLVGSVGNRPLVADSFWNFWPLNMFNGSKSDGKTE